ncbi:MAG: RNase adapter RapZ [Nitrospiria bacterium]
MISGLSGSGKSHAIKCFEDQGFFCIDNLPPILLPKLTELCNQPNQNISRIALGIDIRERSFLGEFLKIYEELKGEGYQIELLFFEARDEILVRRFSETRRIHPLATGKPILEGISLEREVLADLRKKADRIIDTSDLNVHQLKEMIALYYFRGETAKKIQISLLSFGYKHGIPYDAELLFDVRFLPNPNFVNELKDKTGLHPEVLQYISKFPETFAFIDKLIEFLDFLIPQYEKERKSYLTIGIGCTGGKHRSVAIVTMLMEFFQKKGYLHTIRHRDIDL